MKLSIMLLMIVASAGLQAQTKFEKYQAFNGITFEYVALLPAHYDADKTYQVLIAFAGTDTKDDLAEWSISNLWQDHSEYRYIVIVPKVPLGESDWISHPIHHGFNDFLKFINNNYKVENQKFNFLGYKAGCVPAQTYITMLEYPPASLTIISSDYWSHYNDREYDRLADLKIPVELYYNKNNKGGIDEGQHVVKELKNRNTDVTLNIVDDKIALENLINN